MNSASSINLADILNDQNVQKVELVQSLWSGYGELSRFYSEKLGKAVIVKHVSPPNKVHHPKGWHSNLSHTRKLKSYEIERLFYQNYASNFCDDARVPKHVASAQVAETNETILVLEDLDESGFFIRKQHIEAPQVKACIRWLANFHAVYVNGPRGDLWKTGSYWHLATRPDEYEAMKDGQLKRAAAFIDNRLNNAKYLTVIHGDAKLANFCFHHDGNQVAAVDFQYVGGGVGVKDLMLFLGSCLTEEQLFNSHNQFLDYYFQQFDIALTRANSLIPVTEVEEEWRGLYAFCWADFYRFLLGWSPEHFKINQYMQEQTESALASLD